MGLTCPNTLHPLAIMLQNEHKLLKHKIKENNNNYSNCKNCSSCKIDDNNNSYKDEYVCAP